MPRNNDRRKEIGVLYFSGVQKVKAISEVLTQEFDDDVPSDRNIYRVIKELEIRYTPEEKALDQPWQLRPVLPGGVTHEDVPAILKCVQHGALNGDLSPREVTIREAQWIAVVWRSMTDATTELLRRVALWYAIRSRWAVIEGEVLDTTDLDQFLAFGSWRGEAPELLYLAAKDVGVITPMDGEDLLRHMYPMDPKGFRESHKRLLKLMPHDMEEKIELFAQQLKEIEQCTPPKYKEAYSVYANHYLSRLSNDDLSYEAVLSECWAIAIQFGAELSEISEIKGGLTNA